MALSATKICNLALIRIGEARVTDITDTTSEAAKEANEMYDELRDELLEGGPLKGWKFARHRKSVAVDATAPDFEYDYRFQIPSNPKCLRMVSVTVDGVEITDWVREGNYILTNLEDEEVDMIYAKQVTSEADFPPHFAKLFWKTLAARLAFRRVQSEKLKQSIQLEADEEVDKAIAKDNLENYLDDDGVNTVQEAGR
jgi:hypothetical protein